MINYVDRKQMEKYTTYKWIYSETEFSPRKQYYEQ